MKNRVTFTIDESITNWIQSKNLSSSSEFVNSVLLREMESEKNVLGLLEQQIKDKSLLEVKISDTLEKIKIIAEEGNKKERVEAQQVLDEAKKRHEQEISKAKELIYEFPKNFLEKLMFCKSIKEYDSLCFEIKKFPEHQTMIISELIRTKSAIDLLSLEGIKIA